MTKEAGSQIAPKGKELEKKKLAGK
jgi:hypothetical protein